MESIIIDKTGVLKKINIKDDNIEYLSKKCGFKNVNDFKQQTKWKIKVNGVNNIVKLYAKTEGRANNENKYDLPPPVDNILYFGSLILINYSEDNTIINLNVNLWQQIYEKLFGGFEDLANTEKEDEKEEDELDYIDKKFKTKEGYLKDGFVVDDDHNSDSSIDSELSEEPYLYNDE